jgi:hypothetical protein
VIRYLSELSPPRFVLWCYLIWWFGVAVPYFEPDVSLWTMSVGMSAIIGTGLYLSTAYAGASRTRLPRWTVARLYMMPFCVSSFAALIKGRGFLLVFHPDWVGNAWPLGGCALLGALCWAARLLARRWARDRRLELGEQAAASRD